MSFLTLSLPALEQIWITQIYIVDLANAGVVHSPAHVFEQWLEDGPDARHEDLTFIDCEHDRVHDVDTNRIDRVLRKYLESLDEVRLESRDALQQVLQVDGQRGPDQR